MAIFVFAVASYSQTGSTDSVTVIQEATAVPADEYQSTVDDDTDSYSSDTLKQDFRSIVYDSIEAINITASEKTIALTLSIQEDRLVFQLKDNGHGFDEATGKQLFERGFTTKASGSGLGLHSCRSIIENHDGTISITSEGFGKGALTTITFKI